MLKDIEETILNWEENTKANFAGTEKDMAKVYMNIILAFDAAQAYLKLKTDEYQKKINFINKRHKQMPLFKKTGE
jgi:uncharacterized protein YueI